MNHSFAGAQSCDYYMEVPRQLGRKTKKTKAKSLRVYSNKFKTNNTSNVKKMKA